MTPPSSAPLEDDLTCLVVDNLATAVLLFDRRLTLRMANPAAEALLGVSAKKIIGLEPGGVFPDPEYWTSVLAWSARTWRPFTEREVNLSRVGSDEIIVDCTVTPFTDAAEEEGLLVELVRVDRHRRINREEQMMAQHQTAHALVRGLAHEIRNPLGGIRGAAQLLSRELGDPELEEYTTVIISEADRLQKLLDRLLGPRTVPQKQSMNIHLVAERVCKLVKAEAPATVQVSCDYDPSIPEIQADPDQLIQAMLNITRNAVQALQGQGEILLRTRVQRQVVIGTRRYRLAVRVDVIDNGPGIPDDMIEKVFYPMISGRPGGTGLGLSIAQSLVHQHGGTIQCTSRAGETVMSLLLPLEDSE